LQGRYWKISALGTLAVQKPLVLLVAPDLNCQFYSTAIRNFSMNNFIEERFVFQLLFPYFDHVNQHISILKADLTKFIIDSFIMLA
jgi:hypothetical protein